MFKKNNTLEEIEEDMNAFMFIVKELNKDMCDNCDLNTCGACAGR